MKKILSILGAIGLTATISSSAVSYMTKTTNITHGKSHIIGLENKNIEKGLGK